jgi:CRP-like cAMP-binding protein
LKTPRHPAVNGKSAPSLTAARDGQIVQNQILLALPVAMRSTLGKKLKFEVLPKNSRLHEMAEPTANAYFLTSGLASLLNVSRGGKSVEVGLVGREGFVGVALTVGLSTSHTRAVMQVAGTGFRISANDLRTAMHHSADLSERLNRFSLQLAMQATQIAACNRLHDVDARLARWLLMSQDRLGSDLFALTQESLASMLGTRRATVTEAAGILQRANLISYRRGVLKISDRAGLLKTSCDCYQKMLRLERQWKFEARRKREQ